ncbi:MAG: cupin domain-containing protein [Candidatus Brocadiia bacterium]
MKHVHYEDVQRRRVELPGAEKCHVRWLIDDGDGAPNFYMRRFELEPGGKTPRHAHDWEHEVYVLEGEGSVHGAGGEEKFRPGDVVYMPPGEEHYFKADADQPVAFLCLIPTEGKQG